MALSSAEAKAEILNVQQKKANEVMKKTQDIIDQMLPKQVAAVRWCLDAEHPDNRHFFPVYLLSIRPFPSVKLAVLLLFQ